MLTGFRAGDDPDLRLAGDDFVGTRKAWDLPTGNVALLGRVFPSGAIFGPDTTPTRLVSRVAAACKPVLAAGMWPYFSLKPDPSATIGGQLDGHLTELARLVAGLGVPVYFSVWHEPENDQLGASNYLGRATNFVRVHTRAYQVMKPIAGDRLRMGPCHMAYQWRPGSETTTDGQTADAWRVPEDRCDFYAVDAYTSNWNWGHGQTLRSKTDFQRWLTRINPPRSKIILAERGISRSYSKVSDPASAQAGALADDFQYLTSLGAHALLYWNSGGATDDSVYLLGAPARAVFRQAAVAAAGANTSPTDRYQEGYDAGYKAGQSSGKTEGRRDAFREVRDWADSRTG